MRHTQFDTEIKPNNQPKSVWNSGEKSRTKKIGSEVLFCLFGHTACRILVLWSEIKPGLEAWSPNHWTTREFPRSPAFNPQKYLISSPTSTYPRTPTENSPSLYGLGQSRWLLSCSLYPLPDQRLTHLHPTHLTGLPTTCPRPQLAIVLIKRAGPPLLVSLVTNEPTWYQSMLETNPPTTTNPRVKTTATSSSVHRSNMWGVSSGTCFRRVCSP